jgi:aminoglycoside phosphotransferase (APT) family kinase protein
VHLETKAHNLVNLEGGALIKAIKNDFSLDITDPVKVIHGYSSQVFKAKLGDEVIFIRINKKSEKYESEILGYDIFEKIGVPVPKLVAYQRLPITIGQPTMIISAAKGVCVSEVGLSKEMEAKVYEELGSMLRKIHEYKIEGFGPLHSQVGNVKGKYNSWKEYYESLAPKHEKHLTYLLEQKVITEEEGEILRQAHNELKSLDIRDAFVQHQDLNTSHIFVEGGQISGIIDLEKVMAGDPRDDIAKTLVYQTPSQQEAFIKGYGDLAKDSVVTKYLLVIAAGKVQFRMQNGMKEGAEKALGAFRDALSEIKREKAKGIS